MILEIILINLFGTLALQFLFLFFKPPPLALHLDSGINT